MTSRGSVASGLGSLKGTAPLADPAELVGYSIGEFVPLAVAKPSSTEQVAGVLRWANRSGVAVYPCGGRTFTQMGNAPARPGVVLDLSGLNRILDFQPLDLTVSVEAGVTIAQLDAALEQDGKHVPLSAPLAHQATIGGTLATGISGSLRSAYGLPRDWLIGITVVGADGTPSKAGGKVVKNVSGYDLAKLFSGSLGTLGIIVELTFKLRPQPASDQIIAIGAPTLDDAQRAARAAANAAPFLNGCIALSADAAAEARALGARLLQDEPTIVLRANGLESAATEVLSHAMSAVREVGVDRPERRTSEIVETWQAIADLELQTPNEHVRLRLGLPPANLAQAQVLLDEHLNNPAQWIIAADSGLLFVSTPRVDADTIARLRRKLGPLQGRLTIESAPLELKSSVNVWGPAGAGARLMHNIKAQFDPQTALNPGRFVDGI